MPIRFTYDSALRILFTTAEGVISFADIDAHLDKELAEEQIANRELFDASSASTSLRSDQVRLIVTRITEMSRRYSFGPTAIVTQNDVFFGMATMIAVLSELHNGPAVAVFRAFEPALDRLVRTHSE